MSQKISATDENGVSILDKSLAVSKGSKVSIVIMPENEKKQKTPAELLAEIAALPSEGKSESFSNRDHDKILYGTVNDK